MSPLIEAHDVGVRRNGSWLVRNVCLTLHEGEVVTLIGPNGGGKSTTAKAVLNLLEIDEGHVSMRDGLRIGYVPQKLTIDWTLPLTVKRLMTLTGKASVEEINEALGLVGLEGRENASVQNLSGGEFQRALLARALLRKPDLLVLDEPVQGVDFSGMIALYELINRIRRELRCGVLLISHDLHIVMAQTDRVVCLNGHVCCSGSPHTVVEDEAYKSLFGAQGAESLAIYRHHHDHSHDEHGDIVKEGHKCDG